MRRSPLLLFLSLGVVSLTLQGQWLDHRDPKTPRTRDGKPNLAAHALRMNGKPDLSGVWEVESAPRKELAKYLLPGGENGLGEDDPNIYFINFFSDFPFLKEPFRPEAGAHFKEMMQGKGPKPSTLCEPPSLPIQDTVPAPFKIAQLPGSVIVMYETDNIFRQIYTDGRKLPDDPQPSFLGYSVGKWEGDTFVVETTGFNNRGAIDAMGHFHSDAMKLTERFHRRDFGHMDLAITLDDSKVYTQPVTIKTALRLLPDTDLIESFCADNEFDVKHMRGQ